MINLQPQSSASWAQPIEMLYACHQRVKNFCRQLSILPDYLAENGVNQAVKNDVQQILTYFNVAAPLHHDDEEEDFFPALLEFEPKEKQAEIQHIIDELEEQHVMLHHNWDKLSEQLEWLLEEKIVQIDTALIAEFVASYDEHIELEEQLFALGQQYIPKASLAEMGETMASRRKSC